MRFAFRGRPDTLSSMLPRLHRLCSSCDQYQDDCACCKACGEYDEHDVDCVAMAATALRFDFADRMPDTLRDHSLSFFEAAPGSS